MQNSAVNPQLTYDYAYSYPAPGSAHPHGPVAIGPFTITNDADGNQVNTLGTGTSDQSEYLYDEENRLSCANKGPQVLSPSCNAQGNTPITAGGIARLLSIHPFCFKVCHRESLFSPAIRTGVRRVDVETPPRVR